MLLHYVYSQVAILCYSGQELPHLSTEKLQTYPQLINNEVFLTVYQISYEYVSEFSDYQTFNF